jgi:ribosomal protein S18 acetylase RimI-like enzyme
MTDRRLLTARPQESALFRARIASATVSSVPDVELVIAEAQRADVNLIVVRVPTSEIAVVQAVEKRGGSLCDVLLTFGRSLPSDEYPLPTWPVGWNLRTARPSDAPALAALATDAFRDFPGHWHADPRLERAYATELYSRWAADLALRNESADTMLIVEAAHSAIAGFLALARVQDGSWNVPLTAVHPDFRGDRLLERMLMSAQSIMANEVTRALHYETQLTNWPAIRVVSRCGFVPRSSRMTFHLWTDAS